MKRQYRFQLVRKTSIPDETGGEGAYILEVVGTVRGTISGSQIITKLPMQATMSQQHHVRFQHKESRYYGVPIDGLVPIDGVWKDRYYELVNDLSQNMTCSYVGEYRYPRPKFNTNPPDVKKENKLEKGVDTFGTDGWY
ncbi:hypothetical protein LP032_055 [Listeria phage LP-032]|uniref:Uncharacterized protein n=9 Tax=Homburgvirus TaxID=1921125 RepID=A0A5A4K2J3_9CAUD|nr:hypothetical protein P70_0015 [Listeria phage P70]YP_008240439.1 hypothetical protein LP110_075 [Listeria phage LP-110]YP_008240581.1 hypothetical protein LP037_103 [Listeria phage LP-037]YP_009044192.1 hypothetical protein LP026_107 [Listeria phage LP-026]AHL18904.1 hypothetical protein LP032_055 [Listeria phage LP-032]AWY07657.1 hypothetical protein [Listeria phage LP-KV022]QDK04523.1 hypothetical protein FK481_0009 [Listeria phage LP-010]QDK04631.1 hypothetical protein FK482_0009 [List